jgi:hypothetical protein
MKKILLVAVLLMAVSAAGFAQPTASQNTQATATVLSSWTLTQLTNLLFGNVYAGSTYTVASNVAASGSLAFVGGDANTSVTVTWPAAGLTGPGTAIPFSAGTISTHNVAGAGASTLYTGTAVPTDATGHLWIYLGGTIGPIDAGSTAGGYSGTIAVQVSQP